MCYLNITQGVTLIIGGAHRGVNSSSQPNAKWQLLDLEIELVIGCRAEGKCAGGGGKTTCWWERSPSFSCLNLAPWPWLCSPASPRKFHFTPSSLEKAFSCMGFFFPKNVSSKGKNKQTKQPLKNQKYHNPRQTYELYKQFKSWVIPSLMGFVWSY